MEMTPTPTRKSPEPESETPNRIQPVKPISFTNGVLKRHHHHHHHHHNNHNHHPIVISYKECLKNHAATLGGHALDGCGEFMPSPSTNPSDPTSLKCAACGCHRNFHRREPDDITTNTTALPSIEYQPHHRHHPPPPPPPPQPRSPNSASPPPISSSYMLLALSGSTTNNNTNNNHALPFSDLHFGSNISNIHGGNNPGSRKRFRTKFSQYQKERMHEFAERVGWKMQKRDEDTVRDFCREIGVDKGVLKVWMHNNKNTFGRKDPFAPASSLRRIANNDANNNDDHHDDVAAGEAANQHVSDNSGGGEGEGGGGGGGGGGGEHHLHRGFESDSGGRGAHAGGNNTNGSSSSS